MGCIDTWCGSSRWAWYLFDDWQREAYRCLPFLGFSLCLSTGFRYVWPLPPTLPLPILHMRVGVLHVHTSYTLSVTTRPWAVTLMAMKGASMSICCDESQSAIRDESQSAIRDQSISNQG